MAEEAQQSSNQLPPNLHDKQDAKPAEQQQAPQQADPAVALQARLDALAAENNQIKEQLALERQKAALGQPPQPIQTSNPNKAETPEEATEIEALRKEIRENAKRTDLALMQQNYNLDHNQVAELDKIMTDKGLSATDALIYWNGQTGGQSNTQPATPTPDNPASIPPQPPQQPQVSPDASLADLEKAAQTQLEQQFSEQQ